MGMDVYGKSGNYFRNSVWSWRPLADYIQHVAPISWAKGVNWHTNEGGGLSNGADARALAKRLQEFVESGHTHKYEANFRKRAAEMPKVHCEYCDGTGIRTDAVGVKLGFPDMIVPIHLPIARAGQKGYCNACNGDGKYADILTHYNFSVDNVVEFIEFLEKSDGFEIW